MAERRMFAKTIIDSDVFLDMPQTTQNLYFHLNMRADDEGFINSPKKIMRIVGSNQNDLEILLSKRYLIAFESGVIVIKHWKLHNTIRKDRMKTTLYQEEKGLLQEKLNGSYTECPPSDGQVTDKCPPSLVESSVVKCNIDKNKDMVDSFSAFYSAYPKKRSKAAAIKAFEKKYKKNLLPEIEELVEIVKKWSNTTDWKKEGGKFIPHPSTWLNGERWLDELPASTGDSQPFNKFAAGEDGLRGTDWG